MFLQSDIDAVEPCAAAWAPTPMSALGALEIPTADHFTRDHFPPPAVDPATWSLTVQGARPIRLDLDQLRAHSARTLRVVLECAGHRRLEFEPPPPGLPWACGAVAEARWTGVPLADLLEESGIPLGTAEVVLEGADAGPFDGVPGVHAFARSLPLAKALAGDVLVAWAMNDEPILVPRGGPVRVIVPGWYATDSIKWVTRIAPSERPFGGPFEALDYRWRTPGSDAAGERLTALPVNSLITSPEAGECMPAGQSVIRGIAWGGEGGVTSVTVQVDSGPMQTARITSRRGRYARVLWETPCWLTPGAHVITSCARDRAGSVQPTSPAPNEHGYANNAVHRLRVTAQPR